MTPVKRLCRRIPLVRRWAYIYAKQVKAKRKEAQWAYVQSVLVTVGNITIMWAGIERLLDELIAWYQQNCTDLSKKHPKPFSEKIRYLNRMVEDERFTDETSNFFRFMASEAERLSDDRNDIIHGMLWHKGGLSLNWQTQRVVYDGPNASLSHRLYHHDDLQKLSKRISKFSSHIAPKIWVILGGDPEKYSRDQIRLALIELGFSAD